MLAYSAPHDSSRNSQKALSRLVATRDTLQYHRQLYPSKSLELGKRLWIPHNKVSGSRHAMKNWNQF